MCSDRRRDNLKSVELLGTWVPVCHNCSTKAAQLSPMPQSMAGIRRALRRDRRLGDRRYGKFDGRVFQYDRRGVERRRRLTTEDGEWLLVDDEMIVEIEEIASELDAIAAGERAELTQIRQSPL